MCEFSSETRQLHVVQISSESAFSRSHDTAQPEKSGVGSEVTDQRSVDGQCLLAGCSDA